MARPKGFAPWEPKPETMQIVAAVQAVLGEYRDHLPLTVRQIFYRLVGAYNYPKTERDYNNLADKLVRARRAGMIPFSAIRDDGTFAAGGDSGYDSPEDFWERISNSAKYYSRRIREGQPNRIELWCEAGGMVPQLERVASEYGIGVYSTGGFSSVTVTHEIAQRALRAGETCPTVFLHVGDYDPSGESIFDSMTSDAAAFIDGVDPYVDFTPIRVALTEDQVAIHDLETAPPKSTDTRSRNWIGETCQAEAMPPDLLADTVRSAIDEHVDHEQMAEVEEQSRVERDELVTRLAKAMEE